MFKQDTKAPATIQSVMPLQQVQRASTPLVAANVAIRMINSEDYFLTATQALRLALVEHSIDTSNRFENLDAFVDAVAATCKQVIDANTREGIESTRDAVIYKATLAIFTKTFGQMMSITGWLQGKRTMCLDTDTQFRPVKLTGRACQGCSINPSVTSLSDTHERCLNQSDCGWKA